jgi:hypothetical protein
MNQTFTGREQYISISLTGEKEPEEVFRRCDPHIPLCRYLFENFPKRRYPTRFQRAISSWRNSYDLLNPTELESENLQ